MRRFFGDAHRHVRGRRLLGVGALAIAMVAAGIGGFAYAASGSDGAGVSAGLPEAESAIAFPPGVTYGEALRDLHVQQTSGRELVPTETVPALPSGVAALIPESSDGRVVLNPAAPFGFNESLGVPVAPTYTFTGSPPSPGAPKSAYGPWYQGWRLDVPQLPACQVIHERGEMPPPCGPDAVSEIVGSIDLP
jgi:hypothetical protein